MKNFINIVLGALFISIGIGLIMFFVFGNKTNINPHINKENNTYSVNETKEQNLNISNLKQISISSSSTDINVIPENRDNVKIHYYGRIKCTGLNNSKNPIPQLEINSGNNNLTIKTKKSELHSSFNLYFNSNLTLDVFVPSCYKNSMDITSSSGDINIKNFELSSLSTKTSSGDMKINLIKSKNIAFSSSSGNFTCDNLKTDDLHIKTSSGDIKGNTITAKNTNFLSSSGNFTCDNLATDKNNIETSSGDIKMYDYTGSLNLTTTSGDIITEYSKFDNDIFVETSSGDVTLTLPSSSQFYLDSECSSGDISCNFPITVNGKHKDNKLQGTVKSNKNNIKINTSSGDVLLKSKK